MLWISVEPIKIKTKDKNDKHNKSIRGNSRTNTADGINSDNKNLSIVAKLKNLAKSKRKSDFAKTNSFKTDFLTSRAEKTFIYLQKAFTEALILCYFDSKSHLWIEINLLDFAINEILSQMILN